MVEAVRPTEGNKAAVVDDVEAVVVVVDIGDIHYKSQRQKIAEKWVLNAL